MNTKICVRCEEEKDLSEFYIKKNGKPHSYCNDCRSEVKHNWDTENADLIREYKNRTKEYREAYNAEYREKNREILRIKAREDNEKRKESRKAFRLRPEYKEHRKQYEKEWRLMNRDKYNKYFKDYYKNNPNAKIAHALRNRINKILDGRTKHGHLEDLVGCSLDFLEQHLESLFKDGMAWDNHGFGEDKWNIHHFPPLASYSDLSDPEQQKEAFHWSHTFPEWTLENISINSWYEEERHLHKKVS